MIRVFLQHQLVGEFSVDHVTEIQPDNGLVIRDAAGQEVRRYTPDGWHAAGEGLACAHDGTGIDDCERCTSGLEPGQP